MGLSWRACMAAASLGADHPPGFHPCVYQWGVFEFSAHPVDWLSLLYLLALLDSVTFVFLPLA